MKKIPHRLATKRIPSLLAYFAVPSILSLMLHAFYNVADRIFIGRGVGPLGLAAVTFCFPIMLLIFGICMLFSSGASSLISIYLGQNKQNDAERVLGTAIFTITIIGLGLIVLGKFYHSQILAFFNVPTDVLPYARGYLRVILMGGPLFLYGFTMTFVIRAEGNPMFATGMIVAGTVLNLILDPIFIFIFSMGTIGAALATIISEGTVALMGFFYMTRKKGLVHIRRGNLRADFQLMRKIGLLGLSAGLMNITGSVQCAFLNGRLLRYGGNRAVAAMGIIFPIMAVLRLFTAGMAAGIQPIVGYNYGAGNAGRVRDTFLYGLKANLIAVSVFIVAAVFFAEKIVGLFAGNDSELTALGASAMRIFLFMGTFSVVTILASRYFQSVGKGFKAVMVGPVGQTFVFIPMLFLLSYIYGLDGIWFSGPIAGAIMAAAAAVFIRTEMRMLTAKEDLRTDEKNK